MIFVCYVAALVWMPGGLTMMRSLHVLNKDRQAHVEGRRDHMPLSNSRGSWKYLRWPAPLGARALHGNVAGEKRGDRPGHPARSSDHCGGPTSNGSCIAERLTRPRMYQPGLTILLSPLVTTGCPFVILHCSALDASCWLACLGHGEATVSRALRLRSRGTLPEWSDARFGSPSRTAVCAALGCCFFGRLPGT